MRATAGDDPHLPFHASPPTSTGSVADHLMRSMTAALASNRPQSTAEALRVLRRGYPDIPLAMRIAAICAGSK